MNFSPIWRERSFRDFCHPLAIARIFRQEGARGEGVVWCEQCGRNHWMAG